MHNESPPDLRFLFEWLSPPFDAGHWMPDMMHWACVDHACRKAERKSKAGMVLLEGDLVCLESAGDFHGGTQQMVYSGTSPSKIRMMFGATPILGNLHL